MIKVSITSIGFNYNLAQDLAKIKFVDDVELSLVSFAENYQFINLIYVYIFLLFLPSK